MQVLSPWDRHAHQLGSLDKVTWRHVTWTDACRSGWQAECVLDHIVSWRCKQGTGGCFHAACFIPLSSHLFCLWNVHTCSSSNVRLTDSFLCSLSQTHVQKLTNLHWYFFFECAPPLRRPPQPSFNHLISLVVSLITIQYLFFTEIRRRTWMLCISRFFTCTKYAVKYVHWWMCVRVHTNVFWKLTGSTEISFSLNLRRLVRAHTHRC